MKVPYKRSGLRTYLLLTGIISLSSTPYSILTGLPFLLLGIIIRIWAKGYLHQSQEVTISGPYRFVRHPFYLGTFFLDMGICLMSGFIPLMIIAPILWLAVYIPKMKEEEQRMIHAFGKEYERYQEMVSMIIPFRKMAGGKENFSWKSPNILRTEIPRSLRFISYPLIFLFFYLFRIHGKHIFCHPRAFLIIGAIFFCYFMAWQWKRHFSSVPIHKR